MYTYVCIVVFFGCCFWIIVIFLRDSVLVWSCELQDMRISIWNLGVLSTKCPRDRRQPPSQVCDKAWRRCAVCAPMARMDNQNTARHLYMFTGHQAIKETAWAFAWPHISLKQSTRLGWMVWAQWLDDLFEPSDCDSLKRKLCILGIRSSPGKLQALWPVSHVS